MPSPDIQMFETYLKRTLETIQKDKSNLAGSDICNSSYLYIIFKSIIKNWFKKYMQMQKNGIHGWA